MTSMYVWSAIMNTTRGSVEANCWNKIASGQSVALVTDAGTPGVSDPGQFLIEAALQRGMEPVAIPGPTALISALVVSGLSTQPFVFLGFPPAKGAERRRFFEKNSRLAMTLILYESPRRLTKTLKDMLLSWGERRVAVARELTKIHEQIFRGSISEAIEHFTAEIRGELTLVVEGAGPGLDMDSKLLLDSGSPAPGPEGLNRESSDLEIPHLERGAAGRCSGRVFHQSKPHRPLPPVSTSPAGWSIKRLWR